MFPFQGSVNLTADTDIIIARHQYDVTSRQGNLPGSRGAFGSAGILADLDQHTAAFGQAAVIAYEQKRILFQADIHKGCLQSRHHIGHPAQENISYQMVLAVPFDQIFP